MSFRISGKLEGIEEILDALSGLKASHGRTIIRRALIPAGTIVKHAVKANINVEKGVYRRSIEATTRTYPGKNLVMVFVGAKLGYEEYVTIDPDRYFRQIGGTRGVKAKAGRTAVTGVLGVTTYFKRPALDRLRERRIPMNYSHLVERGARHPRKAFRTLQKAFDASKAAAAAKFIEKATAGLENYFMRLR